MYIPPSLSYQAGMRCPHHSWRLMHQSLMFSIQWRYRFLNLAGWNSTLSSVTAAKRGLCHILHIAPPLHAKAWLYHLVGTLAVAYLVAVLFFLHQVAAFAQCLCYLLPYCTNLSSPIYSCAASLIVPSSFRVSITGSLCFRPRL